MVRLQPLRMLPAVWNVIQRQAALWRVGAFPGLMVVGGVVLVRALGGLQNLEWAAYDRGLRSRPTEAPDSRIVIVGINEEDIRRVGNFPVPDVALANLLKTLESYQPRVIGLDLFRDLVQTPGRAALSQVFASSDNIIGIEVALANHVNQQIKPPPELPVARVGLTDAIVDADGKFRRQLLASKVGSGATRYTWALLLSEFYLKGQGVRFQPGDRPSQPLNFQIPQAALGASVPCNAPISASPGPETRCNVQIPRFTTNFGGYINTSAAGNQLLLSFRSHPHPFTVVSLTDVMTGKVKPAQIRDRIVLVGMTNASNNDTFMTSAIQGSLITEALGVTNTQQYQLIYGVELNAHAISEIISAVLDHRPFMQAWDDGWEYLWIVGWGLWGIGLGLMLQSPWKTLLGLVGSCVALTALGYGLLLHSVWVPVVPALLTVTGAGLTTALFDQRAKDLLEQRSLTLKRTYDAVHNGPLQTLAAILRSDAPSERVRSQLQNLNQELRLVYEAMHQSLTTPDLPTASLPDQLYAVYESTLQRELPGFSTIRTYIPPDFSCLVDCDLSPEQQQSLCAFLQEALCNVGKHAVDATLLDVVCDRQADRYRLCIMDNGVTDPAIFRDHLPNGHVANGNPTGSTNGKIPNGHTAGMLLPERGPQESQAVMDVVPTASGWGTRQAKELARQLNGQFHRSPHSPQGVACELTWRKKSAWWSFLGIWEK